MRQEGFSASTLVELLEKRRMVTKEDMKRALGTMVDMTVFRKLRELAYVSSYSHQGKYYTLVKNAEFDARGLWSCRNVHFSKFGSLVDTVEHFVVTSDRGFFASELAGEVQVAVKEPLLNLFQQRRISREQIDGRYWYGAVDGNKHRQQLMGRKATLVEAPFGVLSPTPILTTEAKAALLLFFAMLDEQQRRHFAGLESLRIGPGGDQLIAEWTGLDVHTVGRGRKELLERDLQADRVRQRGGGRKKKRRT